MRPAGCLNVHACLLPRWRGAAPIQRAILAGDPQTGMTIMQMEAGLDTGPMLIKRELVIGVAIRGTVPVLRSGWSCYADYEFAFEQHRAGIEPGFHLHDRHAGNRVAGHDRALDRRRTAPARQQRGMDVDASLPRRIEDRLRQDSP